VLTQEQTNELAGALRNLDLAEAWWLAELMAKARDEVSETRPSLAEFCNVLAAVLVDEMESRPARADAERAELEALFTGRSLEDLLGGPEPGPGERPDFGWTKDSEAGE
jgi:hypothetical protein